MLTINPYKKVQTIILTYDVTPGSFEKLLEILTEAYRSLLSKQPGFVAAAVHVNDAKTRIASYSQWESRDAFQAMQRLEEVQAVNHQLSDLSKGFFPVMYEVAAAF